MDIKIVKGFNNLTFRLLFSFSNDLCFDPNLNSLVGESRWL